MALLEIENLSVEFPSHNAVMHAVDGVSFSIEPGEVLGIVDLAMEIPFDIPHHIRS